MTERQDALHLGGLEDGGRFGSKTPILFFGYTGVHQTNHCSAKSGQATFVTSHAIPYGKDGLLTIL